MSRLNAFVAKHKREIFEDLTAGNNPRIGVWDPSKLKEGQTKGRPQMGAAVYSPNTISLEYIYPDPVQGSVIVRVDLDVPERIVSMPVPKWVVENIWQGDVQGSYQFESDAWDLLKEFTELLSTEKNPEFFGPAAPTRRE